MIVPHVVDWCGVDLAALVTGEGDQHRGAANEAVQRRVQQPAHDRVVELLPAHLDPLRSPTSALTVRLARNTDLSKMDQFRDQIRLSASCGSTEGSSSTGKDFVEPQFYEPE